MRVSPEAERERFIALGKSLCGDHWQTGLARLTGLSRQYISKIANGERPVTDAVHASVVTGLILEIKSLRQRR
jgi:Helix-turn-helix